MKVDSKRIASQGKTFALAAQSGWCPVTGILDYCLPERVKQETQAAWDRHIESLNKQAASEMVIDGVFTVK